MTTKDYINMARLLHRQRERFKSSDDLLSFISVLCNWFSLDNPKFDSAKFIDAVYDEHWGQKPPPGKQPSLMEIE